MRDVAKRAREQIHGQMLATVAFYHVNEMCVGGAGRAKDSTEARKKVNTRTDVVFNM